MAPLLWRVTPNAESAVAALEQLTEKSMHSIRCLLLEGDTPRQLNERQYLALLRLGCTERKDMCVLVVTHCLAK